MKNDWHGLKYIFAAAAAIIVSTSIGAAALMNTPGWFGWPVVIVTTGFSALAFVWCSEKTK